MPLPNFGIPDRQTAIQSMADAASGMQDMMRQLALPMATHVSNALQVTQSPEKFLMQFANRRLGRAAAQIQRMANAASGMVPLKHPLPPRAPSPAKTPLPPGHAKTAGCVTPDEVLAEYGTIVKHSPPDPGSGLAFVALSPDGCSYCSNYDTPLANWGDVVYGHQWFGVLDNQTINNISQLVAWLQAQGVKSDCPTQPPLPILPACGGPGQPECPPPYPPIVPPVPPVPPGTTQPPKPAPGSSCDTPIYMQFCVPKKPEPGTCITDAQGVVTCTPGPSIGDTLPASGGSGGIIAVCRLMPDGSLPPIGSPEWCACLQSLQNWFTNIGQSVVGYFSNPTGSPSNIFVTSLLTAVFGPIATIPLIGDAANNIISKLREVVQNAYDSLINVVGAVAGNVMPIGIAPQLDAQKGAITPVAGQAASLIGLAITRAILRLFRTVPFGTDAGLFAYLNIDVMVGPVETVVQYVTDYTLPTEIPSVADALECLRLNTAPEELVRCWLLLRGADPRVWTPVVYAGREKLSTLEIIELMRRDGFADESIARALRNYGWMDEGEAVSRVKLYNRLPERADFLHYLQRNVYDTDYVDRYQLLDGFADRYLANFGEQLHALGITEEQSKLDYAAHWINASPGELRELLYRLRPDDPETENPFTLEDYERLLAEQDIAPWIRKRMAETAYRVPALGYLRDMYRNFVIDDEEMKGFHQDLGYSEADSDRFVAIDRIIRARIRASESHGYTPAALAAAYSVGNIDADGVTSYMREQGFTEDEARRLMARAQSDFQRTIILRARSRVMFSVLSTVRQSLEAGVIDQSQAEHAITQLGWPAAFSRGWVQIQAQASSVKLIKQATARIRSAFLAGEIDGAYAIQSLASIGIVAQATQQFLAAWSIENTPRRKRRTATQIVNDVSLGEITTADALLRLTNLGYDNADKRLYLADAQRKIISIEQKRIAAERRSELSQAKQLQAALRESRRQHKELLAQYKRVSSPAKLQKWAKAGIIGRDLFYDRLRAQEYPDNDIGRLWDEACQGKNAACVDVSPSTENPPSGLSGTGYPPDSPD